MNFIPYLIPVPNGQKFPAIKDWEHNATPHGDGYTSTNWACVCGPSGIVVLDFDCYHPGVPTPEDVIGEEYLNTMMVRSPRGGIHVYYLQPEGMRLRNATGTLPKGIDVRGYGGLIMWPGSKTEHGEYTYVNDISEVQPLPPHILQALFPPARVPTTGTGYASIHPTPETEEVRRAIACIPTQPGYSTWLNILMAVHSVYPGQEGIAICESWSPGSRGEVARKFASFKPSGITIATLFHIAMQYGYTPPFVPKVGSTTLTTGDEPTLLPRLQRATHYLDTPEFVTHMLGKAKSRVVVGTLISMLSVLLKMAAIKRTTRVYATTRTLGNELCISAMSASRQLKRLEEMDYIKTTTTDKGTAIDIAPLLNVTAYLQLESNESTGNTSCNAEQRSFLADHVGDDMFATYPYAYAIKRRGGGPLMHSIGPNGLLLWPHLQDWISVAGLVEYTGLSNGSIHATMKRFVALGIAEEYAEMEGRRKTLHYQLVDKPMDRMEYVRPHVHTAWIGQFAIARNASQTADYAWWKLRKEGGKMDARTKAWWEKLFSDKRYQADAIMDFLLTQGFDGRMKVGTSKGVKRSKKRNDYGEAWRTWGRQWYDNYNNLLGDYQDRLRQLTVAFAGSMATPAKYIEVKREVRDRLDMALMLAHKRVLYEGMSEKQVAMEREIEYVPEAINYQQLSFT